MASKELIRAWTSYENYIERHGIDDNELLKAMTQAVNVGFSERDYEYAMMMKNRTIQTLDDIIKLKTNGTFAMLEDYAQKNKTYYDYLEWHYQSLLSAAEYDFDSYYLYQMNIDLSLST